MAPRKTKATKAGQDSKATKATHKAKPKSRVRKPQKFQRSEQPEEPEQDDQEDGTDENLDRPDRCEQPQEVKEYETIEVIQQSQEPEQPQEAQPASEVEQPKPARQFKRSKQPKQVQQSQRIARGANRDWSQYTANPADKNALAKNGRKVGRVLIPWTRPRMAEKLLLHIEYESEIRNNRIPWDNVAHRLSPGSSGAAVTQHLARVRRELIAEGHLVPPLAQKPNGPPQESATVRGYIRMYPDSITNLVARKVGWTEPVDDLTKPIGNAIYALQHDENEDNHGEDEIYEDDRDDDENDNGGSSRFAGAGSSSHDLDSTRLARAGNRVSHVKNQEDTFAEDSDSGTEGDDESEDPGVRNRSLKRRTWRPQQASGSKRRQRGTSVRGRAVEAQSGFSPLTATPLGYRHHDPTNPHRQSPNDYHTPGRQQRQGLDNYPVADAEYPVAQEYQGGYEPTIHSDHVGYSAHAAPGMSAHPSTPHGFLRHAAFTTAESSPSDFNFEDASPFTAQQMHAHYLNYNSPTAVYNAGYRFDHAIQPAQNALNAFEARSNRSITGPAAMMSDHALTPGNVSMTDSPFLSNEPSVHGGTTAQSHTLTPSRMLLTGSLNVPGSEALQDRASVAGSPSMTGNAFLNGHASMIGHAMMTGSPSMTGNGFVIGNASMVRNRFLSSDPNVGRSVQVHGHSFTPGNALMDVDHFVAGSAPVVGDPFSSATTTGLASTPGSASMASNLIAKVHPTPGGASMTGNPMVDDLALPDSTQTSDGIFAQMRMTAGALDHDPKPYDQSDDGAPSMFATSANESPKPNVGE